MNVTKLISTHVQSQTSEMKEVDREIDACVTEIEMGKEKHEEEIELLENRIRGLLARKMEIGTDVTLAKDLLGRLESLGYRWTPYCGDCCEASDSSDMDFMNGNNVPIINWLFGKGQD
jgi:hypothetical protein